MLDDPEDLAIVEGVIGLTQAFGRKVIAEGVETVEHGLVLLLLGCDMAQGFGIARPMAAGKLPAWVENFQPDELWGSATAFRWSREDLPLLIAGVDHKRWKKSLYAYLADTSGLLPAPPADPHRCRFGHWYYNQPPETYGNFEDFIPLGQVHDLIHQLGSELMAQRENSTGQEQAARLRELENLSGELNAHLQKIQTEVLLSRQISHR
jgi:hypothetical protein